MMDSNYRVTLELFDYCQSECVSFLYASSAATSGGSSVYAEDPANERPLNVYGYSKLLFDQVLRTRLSSADGPGRGAALFQRLWPARAAQGPHGLGGLPQHEPVPGGGPCAPVRRLGRLTPTAGRAATSFRSRTWWRSICTFWTTRGPPASSTAAPAAPSPSTMLAMAVVNSPARRARRTAAALLDQLVSQGLIRYLLFPDDLKGRYQSYTQADTSRLRAAGFDQPMRDVQTGVAEYVRYWRALKHA